MNDTLRDLAILIVGVLGGALSSVFATAYKAKTDTQVAKRARQATRQYELVDAVDRLVTEAYDSVEPHIIDLAFDNALAEDNLGDDLTIPAAPAFDLGQQIAINARRITDFELMNLGEVFVRCTQNYVSYGYRDRTHTNPSIYRHRLSRMADMGEQVTTAANNLQAAAGKYLRENH